MTDQQQEQQTPPSDSIQKALITANQLNQTLLQSDAEHNLHNLTNTSNILQQTCNQQQNQIVNLQRKIVELQSETLDKSELIEKEKKMTDMERKRAEGAMEMEKDANERMARLQLESDLLRQEISRLNTTNASLTTQLSELTAKSTLSTSSSTSLQFEITRLTSELEAVNSHSSWLESELSLRTQQSSTLKTTHAKAVLDLQRQWKECESEKENLELQLSLNVNKLDRLEDRLEKVQKSLLDTEQNHVDEVHQLNVEIQAERRLVVLKSENIARVEERYNDAVREIESIKGLASAAEKEHEEIVGKIKDTMEEKIRLAIEQCHTEHEKEIQEMQRKMEDVIVEKTKLEDMLMSSGSYLAIGDGSADQQLTLLKDDKNSSSQLGDDSGEPVSIIKLYDKLAEKDDELRREKAERRKCELYMDRIQQDIERVAPQQRQQKREYELAMSQKQQMQSRMQEALQEAEMARDELDQKDKECRQTISECNELRLENRDLARQVQQLLKKSLDGDGDSAMEIQTQNQQLLKEHHRASARVKELEEQLESDSTQQKLNDALEALEQLQEERRNQVTLVSNIVQQRDLYRALLAKNDAQILATSGDDNSTAIIAAKEHIEKYTEVESRNKELSDTISRLNADLLSATNMKQGLEERLKRLDSHAADLLQTNNKLQNDLLVANAATARSNAEASFQMQKVARLDETLETLRSDVARLNDSKKNLQQLNVDLQSMIAEYETSKVKQEEQLRQIEVQLRLAETKVNSLQSAESRLSNENNSLRSELSRHSALQESMLKLEHGVSARTNEERERLQENVERLNRELVSTKNQHAVESEKLQNQVSIANMKIEELVKSQKECLEDAIRAKNDTLQAQTKINELTTKCTSLESSLNAAKVQLGDVDIGMSENDKIQSLTAEVDRLKEEIESANRKVNDYQKLTKASETTLGESTKATIEYKKKTTSELQVLQEKLSATQAQLKAKEEALDGLALDLSQSRGEQEKVMENLKAQTHNLQTEIGVLKEDRDCWKSKVDELSQEIKVHLADVKLSKDNYERELALHAEARKELQGARERAVQEAQLHEHAEVKVENMKAEMLSKDQIYDQTKTQLEETIKQLERQSHEANEQNKILHEQLATMGDRINTIQEDKMNKASQEVTVESVGEPSEELSLLRKQVKELREVVNYMRSEREVIDTQLQSARVTAERERASGEIVKKSLTEARNELEILQQKVSMRKDLGGSSSNVISKLKLAEEQLTLLRESNKLLREDSEKLEKRVLTLQSEVDSAKDAMKPSDEKCRQLEVEKVALQAEKDSLVREVDLWKQRVTSLVSKFNQIDPEEHTKALTEVDKLRGELTNLTTEKESAETQSKNFKTMILKLNKEVQRLKGLNDSNKSALEKTNKEIETLKNSKLSATAEKEIKELKESKKVVTQELEATKRRIENLTRMLKMNKAKNTELKESHDALTKSNESLKAMIQEFEMKEKIGSQDALTQTVSVPNENESKSTQREHVTTSSSDGNLKSLKASTALPKVSTSSSDGNLKSLKSVPPVPKVPDGGFKYAPSTTIEILEEENTKDGVDAQNQGNVSEEKPTEMIEKEAKVDELAKPAIDDAAEFVPKSDNEKNITDESQGEMDNDSKVKDGKSAVDTNSHITTNDSKVKDGKAAVDTDSLITSTNEQDSVPKSTAESNATKAGSKPTETPQQTPIKKVMKVKHSKATGDTEAISTIKVQDSAPKSTNESNVTKAESQSLETPQQTPVKTVIKAAENNLREKLMKRKRELAMKLEASASKKAAISSSSDTPSAAPVSIDNDPKSEVDPETTTAATVIASSKPENESEEPQAIEPDNQTKSNEKKDHTYNVDISKNDGADKEPEIECNEPNTVDPNHQTVSNEEKDEINNSDISTNEGKDNETEEVEECKVENDEHEDKVEDEAKDIDNQVEQNDEEMLSEDAPVASETGLASVFGSGSSTIFGSSSTMNVNAKPFTPSFGGLGKNSSTSTESGAFLNLKPPGSGQATPFVFGSSSKIQLPTPSKTPPVPPSFGTPFGSTPLFGNNTTAATKKRSLETDENHEESSKKVSRTDDEEKDIVEEAANESKEETEDAANERKEETKSEDEDNVNAEEAENATSKEMGKDLSEENIDNEGEGSEE